MFRQPISRIPSSAKAIQKAKAAVSPKVAPRQITANTKLINPSPNMGEVVVKGISTLANLAKRVLG